MGHENKCAHLHGHNYVVELTAASELDSIGRVIDFSVLKMLVGSWIEQQWDHGFILNKDDRDAIAIVADFIPRDGAKQKIHLMPYNPTAENMAKYLLEVIGPATLAGTGVRLVGVVVHETENCKAEATL